MGELAKLDIAPVWARFNEGLIRLVDYVPDDKLNWSPQPELWNFRGILLHIAAARDGWLNGVEAGVDGAEVWRTVRTKDQIKAAYARTWERMATLLAHPDRLDARYEDDGPEGARSISGHWMAFHLLEHDIHHRADIMHYLALLGVAHPDVGTP